ncbi:LPP20 family lipoprotein [Sulfurimonas sp. C5]|uniref:LPP20 family lipoprotein n=1 Tax=Sulfurimonas sp. C5 TaxID=3036947 RepID=UPI00245908B5|nr:LPP20 family lipoprotein [Sulfurimonas sp. C5]MDH4944924.1 LPP20 family lipoprotein [Sulfurimonas sp. C5]
MKYSLVLLALLSLNAFSSDEAQKPVKVVTTPSEMTINVNYPTVEQQSAAPVQEVTKSEDTAEAEDEPVLEANKNMIISVVGQGVAPMNTASPAQAYALAKRAAVADAYRLIAEKVKGVRVDGQDLIKNMMVKRSTVRTSVQAMVRNANIVETNFKEGLCEVEMELTLSYAQFAQ